MILTLTEESRYIMPEGGKLIKVELHGEKEIVDGVYITVYGVEMPYYVCKGSKSFKIPLLLMEGDVLGINADVTIGVLIEF